VSDTGSDSTIVAETTYNLATRRGVSLLLLPATSVVALVPAWAVLCGGVAAQDHRWPFQIAPDPRTWLAFVLVVFVVQVLWSTGQGLLLRSSRPLKSHSDSLLEETADRTLPSRMKRRVPRFPYITPWSPLGRLGRRWHTSTLTESARLTLALVPLLVLILSALIGWPMIVLSLAATALSVIEWRVARQGRTSSALEAGTLVGLGWLAGHVVFAPLSWTSLTMACCFAIAYQGALVLERGSDRGEESPLSPSSRLPWALTLLYAGQGAALAWLVVLERPLAAALLGTLLSPQWLLLALLKTRTGRSYIRHATPFVMVAMLVASWAVSA
jgi:hypothetical protein